MKKTILIALTTMFWSVAAWCGNSSQTTSKKAGDGNLVPVTKNMTVPESPGLLYDVLTFEEAEATEAPVRLRTRSAAPTEDGEEFTANTIEGVEMKFKVISAADKTCQAGILTEPATSWGVSSDCIDRYTEGEITIPSEVEGFQVTAIAGAAFYDCTKITKVNIPSTVVSIGRGAFSSCSGLTSLYIPASVKEISFSAFSSMSALTSIVVDDANPIYDSRDNCNAIIETGINTLLAGCKNTVIPSSVTAIGKQAFMGCTGLTSLYIPATLTKIGGNTTYGLPSSATYAIQTFDNCSGLQTITVDAANTVFDSRDNCNAIIEKASSKLICGSNSTVIPASVHIIGNSAFQGRSLTSMNIPEGVTDINWSAFQNCSSLNSITIPSTVTGIGSYAFYCWNLRDVTTKRAAPFAIEENTFYSDTYTKGTLHVPDGTKGLYKDAYGWNNFQNIDGTGGDDDESAIISTFTEWQKDGSDQNDLYGRMKTSENKDWYANIWRSSANVQYIDDGSGDKGILISDNEYTEFNIMLDAMFSVTGKVKKIVVRGMGNFSFMEAMIINENSHTILESNGKNVGSSTVFTDYEIPFEGTTDYEGVHISLNIYGKPHMVIQSVKIVQEEGTSIPMSGQTGDLSWKVEQLSETVSVYESGSWVNKPTYRLTISGNGYMPSYTSTGYDQAQGRTIYNSPWYPFATIKEIVIEEGVKNVSNNAFRSVSQNLYEVKLPSTIEKIGSRAFDDMSSIVKINFPEGLTTISDYAFPWCHNLNEVNLPSTLTNLETTSFKGNGIKKLTVASGNKMFDSRNNCNAVILTAENKLFIGTPNTVIPATVTAIGTSAFENNNNLKSMSIPNNVTTIGNYAFSSCYALTELTIGSGVTSIQSNAIKTCDKLENVYCYADPATLTWEDYDNEKNLKSKDTKTNFHVLAAYLDDWQQKFPNLNATYVGDLILLGDADGSGSVDEKDVTEVANYIMGQPSDKFDKRGADANNDGVVNAADIVTIVNIIKAQQ